jgi:hypothetical protein
MHACRPDGPGGVREGSKDWKPNQTAVLYILMQCMEKCARPLGGEKGGGNGGRLAGGFHDKVEYSAVRKKIHVQYKSKKTREGM